MIGSPEPDVRRVCRVILANVSREAIKTAVPDWTATRLFSGFVKEAISITSGMVLIPAVVYEMRL